MNWRPGKKTIANFVILGLLSGFLLLEGLPKIVYTLLDYEQELEFYFYLGGSHPATRIWAGFINVILAVLLWPRKTRNASAGIIAALQLLGTPIAAVRDTEFASVYLVQFLWKFGLSAAVIWLNRDCWPMNRLLEIEDSVKQRES